MRNSGTSDFRFFFFLLAFLFFQNIASYVSVNRRSNEKYGPENRNSITSKRVEKKNPKPCEIKTGVKKNKKNFIRKSRRKNKTKILKYYFFIRYCHIILSLSSYTILTPSRSSQLAA